MFSRKTTTVCKKMVLSLLTLGFYSERKEFALEEQILSFQSEPHFQRGLSVRGTNRAYNKACLCRNGRKYTKYQMWILLSPYK